MVVVLSVDRLFSHCCMKLRLGMNVIISHQILNAIMEVLYELLYRKKFYMQTAHHYINLISAGGGGWNPPPPGSSVAIATKINLTTPNFLTFNFYYRDII